MLFACKQVKSKKAKGKKAVFGRDPFGFAQDKFTRFTQIFYPFSLNRVYQC